MLRPHSPHETPAEKPAHSGEGQGVWLSPWELDQEWQDAPPARKRRRVFDDEIAAPEPPLPPKTVSVPEEVVKPPPVEKAKPVPARAASATPPTPRIKPPKPVPDGIEREASWGTLTLLSLALLVVVFVVWVFVQDQESGFDEDLLVKRPVDQAATIRTPDKLRKFLGSLAPMDAKTVYGEPPWLWDTPTLSRVVQANGTALDNLRDLLEDAEWHAGHASWHGEDLGSDARWTQALLLKQVEAAYLSRRLQEEEAFTVAEAECSRIVAAIDLAEIGWRLEQIQAWPSFYLRSLEAQTRAAQTLADLLRQTKLPEATLRQFQRQFTVSQPGVEMLASAMNAFYVHEKKLILGPKSGENLDTMPGGAQLRRPGRLFFKPNETLQLFATAFRQLKDETKAPLALTSEVRLKNAPTSDSALQPNAEGQSYFMRRMKIYTGLPAFLGLVRTRATLVGGLFAIRRCIAEKKTVPLSLEQLRSYNYLLEVPLDPYSGAPLQYSFQRGLLWSVGNDLKSANGFPTEPPMSEAGEPTAQTGVAVAAAVE